MTQFTVHTKQTAPKKSVQTLETAEKAFGFIPNLIGVLAESPAAAKGYLTLSGIFDESSLTATERQVVILTASRYNECHYCMAGHSVIADMQNVPQEVVDAIRNDQSIENVKLEALRQFTTQVVDKRGWVSEEDIQTFLQAGYNKQQIIEVILGVTFKTLSNYVNHVTQTPVDDAFASKTWQPVNGTTRAA